MATWNSTYEALPQNTNNPGYGAQAIRELKVAIKERMNRFAVWGDDETSYSITGGTPREGSARASVYDSDYTNREDIVVPTNLIGQLVVDLEQRSTDRTVDDVDFADTDQSETANLNKVLRVVMYDSTLGTKVVPLFDYDSMVDIYQDQAVGGRKDFTLSPLVPNLKEITDPDWRDYIDLNDKLDAAVNVKEAYEGDMLAKFHNLFDPSDQDNIDEGIVATSGDHPNTEYVNKAVHVDQITANSIKGVVWV